MDGIICDKQWKQKAYNQMSTNDYDLDLLAPKCIFFLVIPSPSLDIAIARLKTFNFRNWPLWPWTYLDCFPMVIHAITKCEANNSNGS